MTKTELAQELVRVGLVAQGEIQPYGHTDQNLEIIAHYLLYPDGYPKSDEEWEDDIQSWSADLEEAIFLASKCSTVWQWIDALARHAAEHWWKCLRRIDPATLPPGQRKEFESVLRKYEQLFDEFGQRECDGSGGENI